MPTSCGIVNSVAIVGDVVWRIVDLTLDMIGARFKPLDARKGNEPLVFDFPGKGSKPLICTNLH